MIFIHDQQIHIAVNTAVESEVRLLGINPVIDSVVDRYYQPILLFQPCCNIGTEG